MRNFCHRCFPILSKKRKPSHPHFAFIHCWLAVGIFIFSSLLPVEKGITPNDSWSSQSLSGQQVLEHRLPTWAGWECCAAVAEPFHQHPSAAACTGRDCYRDCGRSEQLGAGRGRSLAHKLASSMHFEAPAFPFLSCFFFLVQRAGHELFIL